MKNIAIPIIIAAVLAAITYPAIYYSQWDTQVATVTDKQRITKTVDGNDQSYYLVYTDKGTFKVEDSIVLFRFNSSDLYGSIKQDSTYTFQTVGFRAGFLSEYPNVVTVN